MREMTKMQTISEAAAAFGLSRYYVRQLAVEGRVAAVRSGRGRYGKILINAESLGEYLRTATIAPRGLDNER